MRGTFDDGRLYIDELHRFENAMVTIDDHDCWELDRLYEEILIGLKKAATGEMAPASVGVDTWGVDYALLGEDGRLVAPAIAYRDKHTEGAIESFTSNCMRAEDLYARTGIQFIRYNTVFQLHSALRSNDTSLARAQRLLLMPDYFHYRLSGKQVCEYTVASTTGMLSAATRVWDEGVVEALGFRRELLCEPTQPGTRLGPLKQEIADATGLRDTEVVLPASHDTASAVVAVPAVGRDWMFISTGTWCLAGMELDAPICSEDGRAANFTNEGSVNGTIRFLRNIMGLWLVRGIKSDHEDKYSYAELEEMAAAAPPFAHIIDANYSSYMNPASMTDAIDAFCQGTGQPKPDDPGEYVRAAMEGLALQFRHTLEDLRRLQDQQIRIIHAVGGGIQHHLLMQMTADATGLEVLAGPTEGTAMGNLLVQAMGLGKLQNLEEARDIVRRSIEITRYTPTRRTGWESAYDAFMKIKGS
jgi:rhamnulokinase